MHVLNFCSSDEEIPSDSDEEAEGLGKETKRVTKRAPKRKLEMEDYPKFAAKRFADFRAYRNSTLQKWHDKTKLASGKAGKARIFGLQWWPMEAIVCSSLTA